MAFIQVEELTRPPFTTAQIDAEQLYHIWRRIAYRPQRELSNVRCRGSASLAAAPCCSLAIVAGRFNARGDEPDDSPMALTSDKHPQVSEAGA